MVGITTVISELDVATGPVAKQVQVGYLTGHAVQQNGVTSPTIKLQNVTYLPTERHNLWSISKKLQDGWHLTGDTAKMVLSKHGVSIAFDIVVPTTTGKLYCLKFIRHGQEATCIGIKTPIALSHWKIYMYN